MQCRRFPPRHQNLETLTKKWIAILEVFWKSDGVLRNTKDILGGIKPFVEVHGGG